jgi:hypothetical protein
MSAETYHNLSAPGLEVDCSFTEWPLQCRSQLTAFVMAGAEVVVDPTPLQEVLTKRQSLCVMFAALGFTIKAHMQRIRNANYSIGRREVLVLRGLLSGQLHP